ncbi:MAG: hypothetical protein H7123_05540, partial [Thermoleophilia bacterium]|nr:hypothetical protein [Thermoleophilia bacterium]
MSRRNPSPGPTDGGDVRTSRASQQRKRRRKRVVRGLTRTVIWVFVLGAVFVFGIGFGRTISRDEGGADAPKVTVERDRGAVTATLPTTTVTTVETVTTIKKVKSPR